MKVIVKITPEASIKSMGVIDRFNNVEYKLDVVPNIGDYLRIGDYPVWFTVKVSERYIDSKNHFVEIWI